MKHLGEKPLARLVALQERAIELLKQPTAEAASAANEVMAEALDLAKLLAEGEEDRDWTDDDQEPEASEGGEAGQAPETATGGSEGKVSEVAEAGQEGEGQDGQDPEDTASKSEGEPGEVVEPDEETPAEAGESHGRGSKPGRRGRGKGGRA